MCLWRDLDGENDKKMMCIQLCLNISTDYIDYDDVQCHVSLRQVLGEHATLKWSHGTFVFLRF